LKKLLVAGVIVLFIGMSISSSTGFNFEKDSTIPLLDGKTLYVGGSGPSNYTKIQDAIDDASDGDTVFVYDYSSPYIEIILVNKSINLIGEDRDTTIINGKGLGCVVRIEGNEINFSGFTIQNDGPPHFYRMGIDIYGPSININIYNNIIRRNRFGIYLRGEDGPVDAHIYDNIIIENKYGIEDWGWHEDSIVEICHNIVSNNEEGINAGHNYSIYENRISNNSIGIFAAAGYLNFIHHNQIIFNDIGIKIFNFQKAHIYKNNFILNKNHASISRVGLLSERKILRTAKQNWSNNYWGRPRLLLKPVIGLELLLIYTWFKFLFVIPIAVIPYVEFDLHPARIPYDIEV